MKFRPVSICTYYNVSFLSLEADACIPIYNLFKIGEGN